MVLLKKLHVHACNEEANEEIFVPQEPVLVSSTHFPEENCTIHDVVDGSQSCEKLDVFFVNLFLVGGFFFLDLSITCHINLLWFLHRNP